MLRAEDIYLKMKHLCGFSQSFDRNLRISGSWERSESGLRFTDAHPLLTIANMMSVLPSVDIVSAFDEYDASRVYAKWDKVRYRADVSEQWRVYMCLRDDTSGVTPYGDTIDVDYEVDDLHGAEWGLYDVRSAQVEELVGASIRNMVTRFLDTKGIRGESAPLLESKVFFDGAGRVRDTEKPDGSIVGYELVPLRSGGITIRIDEIGLQFNGNVSDVDVYVFHSSNPDARYKVTCRYTRTNGGVQWFTCNDMYLPYVSAENGAGGAWYVCYNQNDLPFDMWSVKVSKDWSKEPCGTCNLGSVEDWRAMARYMQVSPFKADAEGFDGTLWDTSDNVYTIGSNHGMNIRYSVLCDLTDLIVTNRDAFASVLQKQFAYDVLRAMAMNPDVRVNRNVNNIGRNEILYELDGDGSGRRGLGADLTRAYGALNVSTEGLDRACLTCRKYGVKYGAVR